MLIKSALSVLVSVKHIMSFSFNNSTNSVFCNFEESPQTLSPISLRELFAVLYAVDRVDGSPWLSYDVCILSFLESWCAGGGVGDGT
jgi:hypothetical protein